MIRYSLADAKLQMRYSLLSPIACPVCAVNLAAIHSVVENNLFRLRRGERMLDSVRRACREPRRVMWPKVKRRVKSALVRIGLE